MAKLVMTRVYRKIAGPLFARCEQETGVRLEYDQLPNNEAAETFGHGLHDIFIGTEATVQAFNPDLLLKNSSVRIAASTFALCAPGSVNASPISTRTELLAFCGEEKILVGGDTGKTAMHALIKKHDLVSALFAQIDYVKFGSEVCAAVAASKYKRGGTFWNEMLIAQKEGQKLTVVPLLGEFRVMMPYSGCIARNSSCQDDARRILEYLGNRNNAFNKALLGSAGFVYE